MADITVDQIMDALRQCYDPEIPCNIVDLGLIYDVQISDANNVTIKMTLTVQTCPMRNSIIHNIQETVAAITDIGTIDIDLVWDPPWTPDMMSEAGRKAIGMS